MSNCRKSRKRAGTLLAILGVMGGGLKQTETSSSAAYNSSYSDSKNKFSDPYVSSSNNFSNLKVDEVESMEKAEEIASNSVNSFDKLIAVCDELSEYAKDFSVSTKVSMPSSPGFFARLFNSDSVRTAADTAESIALDATQKMKLFMSKIENFQKSFLGFGKFDNYTQNPNVNEVVNTCERLDLNFSDLNSSFDECNQNAFDASRIPSLAKRYDEWVRIYKTLRSSGKATDNMILTALNSLKKCLNGLKEEMKKFPEAYKNYLENKEQIEAERLERLKNNFEDEKKKQSNSFENIKSVLKESYENVWKSVDNVDPDVSNLIKNKYDAKFKNLEDEIARIINTISNLSVYTDENVKKINNSDKVKQELEEKRGNFISEIEDYKNSLTKKKNKLNFLLGSFENIKSVLKESYENVWKSVDNVDPDISNLIQNKYDAEFQNFNDEIVRVINTIPNLSVYDENAKKIDNLEKVKQELEEKRTNFISEIEDYKNSLTKEKKGLKSSKDDLVNKVNHLSSDVDSVWRFQCSKFKNEKDLNGFITAAEPIYNTAKNLCDQLSVEIGNIQFDLNSPNPKSGLESGSENIENARPQIETSIKSIKNQSLLMRINIAKKAISDMIEERNSVWKKYEVKFSPKYLDNKTLEDDSSGIWNSLKNDYDEEVAWTGENIDDMMKKKEPSEKLANDLDFRLMDLSNRVGTFKDRVSNAVAKMNDLIMKFQSELALKRAWERIFWTAGNYDSIKKEVGGACANASDEDSQKIAKVIDGYLPGTYQNILTLCNKMKQKMGVEMVLISGMSGWGKTQSVDYLINATNAQKVTVEYKDLLKSGDGVSYARELLSKYRGKKEPLIMVLDEFDIIAKPRGEGDSAAALVNAFFDEVKKMSENPNDDINLRLVVCISNMNKDQLDSANMSRLTDSLTFGNNPDYKRIISVVSAGCECNAIEGNKENFINNIARTCDSLKTNGRAPSARNILKAFQTVQSNWCSVMNKDKKEGDKDYSHLWHAQLKSEDICTKIKDLATKQS